MNLEIQQKMTVDNIPHVAIIPNVGMGHLTPFLRLASMLLSRNCNVTLITAKPIPSIAEANHISFFLAKYPKITHLEYQLLPPEADSKADAFHLLYNAVRRSTHLVHPLLKSAAFSTIVCDFMTASSIPRFVAAELGVPCYVFHTTSPRFLSFLLHLPNILSQPERIDKSSSFLEIPGLVPFNMSSIPAPFLMPDHFIPADVKVIIKEFPEATGIMMNSFDWFDPETISALNSGTVSSSLPPVHLVGPMKSYELEEDRTECVAWLNKQPRESVVYVNFGSRTAMSHDQIQELGKGLEQSGLRFLWVVKTSKIDKEDRGELSDVLGDSFLDRTRDKGLVLRKWVNQEEVLSHPSVGLFLSHCGWNSVMEAAEKGVPVLGWPLHGDQRMNAEVLEKAGLGKLERSWGFGPERLVEGEEIAAKVSEMMGDGNLRRRAMEVKEEARKATEPGGSSYTAIMKIIGSYFEPENL